MRPPDDTPPFQRLREVLSNCAEEDDVHETSRAAMSPELERVALSPGWPAPVRLAAISNAARLASTSLAPLRERQIVIQELSRLALRVLWWEGLLGPGIVQEAPGDVACAALIELCANGMLPEGPAGWMVLERAKALLKRSDVVRALRENAPRRDRLLEQLVHAEARVRPLAI